jgi:GNAT superfamily N-acetyltransferase
VEEVHRDRAALIEAAMGQEAELVGPRFARGCRCYVALLDGAVAGYGWVSTGPEWIGELQLEIRPRKAEAYIWNCVTLPEHRRKGVFRSLVLGATESTLQIGMRRAWIGTVDLPATRVLEPSGFRPAVHFRTFSLAGLFIMSASFVDSPLGRDARHVLPDRRGWYLANVTRRRH